MYDHDIERFPERRTVEILRQVRDAFEELRRKGVMHRDLKLSNIFMHDDRVIIGSPTRRLRAGQDRPRNDRHAPRDAADDGARNDRGQKLLEQNGSLVDR